MENQRRRRTGFLFCGGIAGGTAANLKGYLFGFISTVTALDVWLTRALAVLILSMGLGLRPALFALSHDEEFARASGLPIRALNMLVAVLAALTCLCLCASWACSWSRR